MFSLTNYLFEIDREAYSFKRAIHKIKRIYKKILKVS